jgi:hypothetical protein
MGGRPAFGELALAVFFGAAGIVWVAIGAGMTLWQGFAPASGFLPLIYGLLLAILSAAILVDLFVNPGADADRPFAMKPLLVIMVVTATVLGISVAGFAVAIFLMVLFLLAVVERLPLHWSFVVAAGTAGALIVIFKIWLSVPLPLGPIGI